MDARAPLAERGNGVAEVRRRLKGAQKPARGAPGYTRWVNRPMGRYLASVAFVLGLTPNQVTAVSAVLTTLGITLIAAAPMSWAVSVVIALTLALAFALDSADGQLARLTGKGGRSGEWLDHVVDAAKTSALHLAVLIGWYRGYELEREWLYLIPILYAFEATVFYFSIMLTEQLRREGSPPLAAKAGESAPALRSILVLPADYGLLCLSFLFFAWPEVFIVLYAMFLVPNIIFLLGAWVRWYREMKAIDAASGRAGDPA